MTLHKK